MVDPDKTPKFGIQISGEHRKDSHADLEASGGRPITGGGAGLLTAIRAALELAQATGARVSIALRGDPAHGVAMRVVEGTVAQFETISDGRERVRIAISEDAEQLLLLEKMVRVVPARG